MTIMLHATDATSSTSVGLLEALLREQQSLTAVDQFAKMHEGTAAPAGAKYYRDLIPASSPGEGQQYAFEVDLDACSGCKACVAACHSLNGLEEGELWRNVGQLVGGTNDLPVLQHVTMACHHCVEPACLEGCPVEAYEKDPVTGIVRHLDDHCIGCQYCMLKCPFDVPVYSKSKGIVRKCDMCHQRLENQEAPACVQACPNQAIRIRLVEKQSILDEIETHQFLPAAPDPAYTVPATVYTSKQPMPRNVLPADYFSVQRAHGHLPLVFMLVLTQMSVGAFLVDQVVHSYFALFREELAASVGPLHISAALVLGMLGLAASIFHLGRPLYAYRALLGLKTSWLSREILAFSVFAAAATGYVAVAGLRMAGWSISEGWQTGLGVSASATGLLAVLCSVMIYVDTRRPCWRFPLTCSKFLMTALILGIPTALFIALVAAAAGELTLPQVMTQFGHSLCRTLLTVTLAKLLLELSVFSHLNDRQHTPQKRSALLMIGELGMTTLRRFFFAVAGGVVMPLILLAEGSFTADAYHPLFVAVITLLMLGLLTIGELHERYLFFTASVAPKMPGSPAA